MNERNKNLLKNQSLNYSERLREEFNGLVESVLNAIARVGETHDMERALMIRDEIRRLPDDLVTEILNQVILRLVLMNPDLCRWFLLEVFLHDAVPEAKADVAERINLLLADLQTANPSDQPES